MNFENLQNIFEGAWGVFLIALFFGGSIFVHELGHFLAARKRGLKIERFSIGFGPRIFGWTGKDGVDYRVSLLPLGGYVALPQMVDMEAIEGKNDADLESLPPISYADKMIVAVMGAVFNVLFAFVLACILWATKMPVPASSITTTIGYVSPELPGQNKPSPALTAGLLPGDKILVVDGTPVTEFTQILEKIALGSGRDEQGRPQVTFTIERNGEKKDIIAKPDLIDLNPNSGDAIRRVGILPASDIVIEKPAPGSPAELAGLKQGDEIISLNGTPVYSLHHFKQLLDTNGTQDITLAVRSATGETRAVKVTPVLRTDTVELASISFKDGDTERKLRLVPVPEDLFKAKPAAPRRNLMVFDVLPASSSLSGILRPGTQLTSINLPESILAVRTPAELVEAAKSLKNDTATLFFKTGNDQKSVTLENFKAVILPAKKSPFIGIQNATKAELVRKSPLEQFRYAFGITFATLHKLIDRNSDVSINQLMGVVSIAKTYYSQADDIKRVLWFTLIININLAILNLLPFPVLDGGHMLFATIQRILGRPLPIKIIAGIQYVFVILFVSLMGYVLMNDVKRCSGDNTLELRSVLIDRYVSTDPFPELTAPTTPPAKQD